MKKIGLIILVIFTNLNAQNVEVGGEKMQFFRKNDKNGVNVFETTKLEDVKFEKMSLSVGAQFTQQMQFLDHHTKAIDMNTGQKMSLDPLSYGFNNATANLILDIQLADGVRMNLTSYMSSRHQNLFMVKGGYLQVDKLAFLNMDFVDDIMKYVTLKGGHMEINYGDQHFRRTDNGNSMYNPFIGNYIMDAFTTEIGAEVYFQANGFLLMVAATNGNTYGDVQNSSEELMKHRKPSVYYKIGYDEKLNEDLRVRLTASGYNSLGYSRNTLFAGDRSGSRYYGIFGDGDFSGRYSPYTGEGLTTDLNNEFDKMNAVSINPFIQWRNFEFFGTYEMLFQLEDIKNMVSKRNISQMVGEVVYRSDKSEYFQNIVGLRYGLVTGDLGEVVSGSAVKSSIQRLQASVGTYMTKNVLIKAEYVYQKYDNFKRGVFDGGSFNGLMVEAVIGF